MKKKIWINIVGGVFSLAPLFVSAMEAVPGPKVLLSGGNHAVPLEQQINDTMPQKPIQSPAFEPEAIIPSQRFQVEIHKLNDDIEKFVKKMTPEAKSLNSSDLSKIYLSYKNAQQINVLLQQQDQIINELGMMNSNMKVLIKQNNVLLKYLMAQDQKREQERLNSSFIQVGK